MRRFLISAVPLLAALAFAPAQASAATQHASLDDVSATLSYSGSASAPTHLHLQIVRGGATVLDRPVSSKLCGTSCDTFGGEALRVADLNANGEPAVLVDLFSGGAHCCEIVQIFTFRAGSTAPVETERNFGDVGTSLRRLGPGRGYEFVTADELFVYEFTSFAASGYPLQILRFNNGRFTNVTRSYPKLIRANAAAWWKLFVAHTSDGEGVFAAWAADQELLGHRALVAKTLNRELKARRLHGNLSGKHFAGALLRLLERHGYIRG